MGFNYIYSQAKTHTKAWSDSFSRSADDLFASAENKIERTFVAKSNGRIVAAEGDSVHVRLVDGALIVYQGMQPLAAAEHPSIALSELIDARHGVVQGVISEIIDAANLVLIKVTEGGAK